MSPGKAAAQAGHAWVDVLLSHPDWPHTAPYARLRPGTKLTLDGGCADSLLRMAERLDIAGLPHSLIYDESHVEPPHFDGSRILTALGVGPFPKGEEPRLLRRLPLWRGGGCAM